MKFCGGKNVSDKHEVAYMFPTQFGAEAAVLERQKAGFDMLKISIIGKDYQATEHVHGFLTCEGLSLILFCSTTAVTIFILQLARCLASCKNKNDSAQPLSSTSLQKLPFLYRQPLFILCGTPLFCTHPAGAGLRRLPSAQ